MTTTLIIIINKINKQIHWFSHWWLRFRRFRNGGFDFGAFQASRTPRRSILGGGGSRWGNFGYYFTYKLEFFFAYFQVLDLLFLVLKFVNDNFRDAGPLKQEEQFVGFHQSLSNHFLCWEQSAWPHIVFFFLFKQCIHSACIPSTYKSYGIIMEGVLIVGVNLSFFFLIRLLE